MSTDPMHTDEVQACFFRHWDFIGRRFGCLTTDPMVAAEHLAFNLKRRRAAASPISTTADAMKTARRLASRLRHCELVAALRSAASRATDFLNLSAPSETHPSTFVSPSPGTIRQRFSPLLPFNKGLASFLARLYLFGESIRRGYEAQFRYLHAQWRKAPGRPCSGAAARSVRTHCPQPS